MPPDPDRPGLASERTALAWERVAAALLTVGALIAVAALRADRPGWTLVTIVPFGVSLACVRHARRSYRARRSSDALRHPPPERAVRWIAAATIATAVVAAIVVVVVPLPS